jgi:deoxyribodipyrimidine photo-lyase
MEAKRSIVWFKSDLRISDNEALVKAVKESEEIIPVYIFDEADYVETAFGTKKTGSFRFQFLLESLTDLNEQLNSIGSKLVVLKGDSATVLGELIKKYNVSKIYCKQEVAYEEKVRLKAVEEIAWKLLCTVETFSTSTLYHASDLPFPLKNIPEVFTNFRKKVEKESTVRPISATLKSLKSPILPKFELPQASDFGLKTLEVDQRTAFPFKGGETHALKRLNDYLFETHLIEKYKETRNGLVGESYSSKLSPWLTTGCISPKTIYFEIKRYEKEVCANESTYWLIFELLWRDYFRFMMKKHNQEFFLQFGIKGESSPLNPHQSAAFEKWKNGETGNNFIDANMLELKLTGFMSNRGRQNVASYLHHDLQSDWRYGAAYFEEQLIDYDVCSNWGNWAYLAGVGNDPRGNRKFDTDKQAKEYDGNEAFRNYWLTKK